MEDKFLIEGLLRRDSRVFDQVFTHYYSGLCAYANRYLNDTDQAEDVVQDIFVKLWSVNNDLKINTSLKNYFAVSVRNKCLDIIKHRKVINKHIEQEREVYKVLQNYYPLYTETELEEILSKALAKLPPRCREIFEMSRFEGLNNQIIADKLSISKRTVELQISNALKILRQELSPIMSVGFLLWLLK